MFRRKREVAQNEIVARRMRKFFRTLKGEHRAEPDAVAKIYGQLLWDSAREKLVGQKRLSRSRFYVGLSTNDNFDALTKRTVLISDTLLLSHDWAGEYHHLGEWEKVSGFGIAGGQVLYGKTLTQKYGMHCPSLAGLGRWILDVKPLLSAGLVWYLPSYSISYQKHDPWHRERLEPFSKAEQVKAVDYLIRDGRAVDASGAEPIKSQLVRPVLRIDLPFVEGVNLHDFSKITIGEFASYSAFRDFLRQNFLEMDMALNAVQSDRELLKLSLQIKDHVRAVRSEMETARRKKIRRRSRRCDWICGGDSCGCVRTCTGSRNRDPRRNRRRVGHHPRRNREQHTRPSRGQVVLRLGLGQGEQHPRSLTPPP